VHQIPKKETPMPDKTDLKAGSTGSSDPISRPSAPNHFKPIGTAIKVGSTPAAAKQIFTLKYSDIFAIPLIALVLLSAACRLLSPSAERLQGILKPDKPSDEEQQVLSDWFVTICTYLDTNHSGGLDDNDEPLGDARFYVDMAGGISTGGVTSPSSGCYTATIPGGGAELLYPMTVTITPPEDAEVTLIGSESVELEYPISHVDYLFAPPSEN
jgi:hypothetical protein